MKILMLGWELPPHNSGGLGVACMNLSRALSRDGAEIDFLVPYEAEHPDATFKVIPAIKLDPICRFGLSAYESRLIEEEIIPGLENKELFSIRDIQRKYRNFVREYLNKNHPDIVHAHDWLTFEAGMLAKREFNIPFIAHVHATEYDRSGMNGGNPIIHEIEREALNYADQVVAVSNTTKNIIHEKYGVPLSKIKVLYNSLDDNFLKNDYEYNCDDYSYIEHLKGKGYVIVSTVGRFTIQKGLTHMMRAAADALKKNPNLMFIFAGDGEERNELIDLTAKYGISNNVIFTGFIRGDKLRDIYEMSDIFIMSSVSEPFGLTALEAACHGDVLILTKQSGVSEVIRSALNYDFWDEKKLAENIVSVAADPKLRDTLKTNVEEEYKALSWEKIAKKCLLIYDELEGHNNERD